MLRSYLKTALRNLKKYFGYSLINIIGLTIGLSCCILIMLWVRDELSYDRFHENSDRIYRVTRQYFDEDGTLSMHFAFNAFPLAPLLEAEYPEIEQAVRLYIEEKVLVSSGERHFLEDRLFFASDSINKVFTLDFIQGNPETALMDPYSVVITDETARKYFSDTDPMGKTLTIELYGQKSDLNITGVVKAWPHNSHFRFNQLVSLKTWSVLAERIRDLKNWGINAYPTYILLAENADVSLLQEKLSGFVERYFPEKQKPGGLTLQKLTDIHLFSHLDAEVEPTGEIAYVYIFSVTALFILLIACFNFMNLATARSSRRAREVGVRKVVGANRTQLIRQFLSESTVIAFIALLVSVFLIFILLPWFNRFVHKELSFNIFFNLGLFLSLLGIAVLVGILSGIYPALFLSAFQPVLVLKGILKKKVRSLSFRSFLVVFQFSISVVLLICMAVVTKQLNFISKRKLGFDREHVVVLPADLDMARRMRSIKDQLLDNPHVLSVTASKHVPTNRLLDNSEAFMIKGDSTELVPFRVAMLRVDYDYIPTYRMEVAAGRIFSRELVTDADRAFILNETAVERLGWSSVQDAVGKEFGYGRRRGTVIGVVKDFHFESLHQEIVPLVLLIRSDERNQVSIRIDGSDISGTLAFLKKEWEEFRPGYPFSYFFIDENLDRLYMSERNLQQVFSLFSCLAVLIACLGLFGLSSFTAEQRTKEIGIRKVLGCSAAGVVRLLSREFLKWVILANVIAWPAGYALMKRWLVNFPYRTALGAGVFILSALVAISIALFTVGYQSVKSALANPAESLKYE